MEMAVWILFCFFASIGLVQCGSWIIEALKRPQDVWKGYFLIPLYDDAETLEARMRYGVSRMKRYDDNETVLFVDMGLAGESAKICEKILLEYPEFYISESSELPGLLERLEEGLQDCFEDGLQDGLNDVE